VAQSTKIDTCVHVNHNKILSAPLLYSTFSSKLAAYNDRANKRDSFFWLGGNTCVSIDGTWVINTYICVGCQKISWCHFPLFDFQRSQEFWIFVSHSSVSGDLCFLESYTVMTDK
jgi:hypothetical protein